jgi:prepilin-type N-terminal cleavage/methylation domain-containing protein
MAPNTNLHMTTSINRRRGAFSLIEMMVTVAVVALCGGMVFFLLNSGMNLYAKNTAVNVAHQQARAGVDQMLANIHAAVSIPQLVDGNLVPLPAPGTGPAVGVDFQRFEAGPFLLWTGQNVTPDQTWISVYAKNWTVPQNTTSLRLNIPSHDVEMDIVSIIAFGDYRIINFSGPVGKNIIVKDDGSGNGRGNAPVAATSNVSAFITRRVSYAVIGTELRYFPNNDLQAFRVIARNVISPTPFSILLSEQGSADFRSVAAVNLSTAEPQYSNRGYAAVNMFISSYIPFRSRLTNTQ